MFHSLTKQQARFATSTTAILPHLPPCQTGGGYTFVKPSPPDDIRQLWDGMSRIVRVQMEPQTIIPIHVHEQRCKVYIFDGTGTFMVYLFRPKTETCEWWYSQVLNITGRYVLEIPPGTFHAVVCLNGLLANKLPGFTVHMHYFDPEDIHWEPGADELLEAPPYRPAD